MLNSSIEPIDRTLSGAINPGKNGLVSDSNEGVFRFPQSPSLAGASPSDCLVSYPRQSLGDSYYSAEMQSVNSAGSD